MMALKTMTWKSQKFMKESMLDIIGAMPQHMLRLSYARFLLVRGESWMKNLSAMQILSMLAPHWWDTDGQGPNLVSFFHL